MDYFVKSPRLLSRLVNKSLVWHMPAGSKTIYLTFDDGPVPEVTPKVLDILDHYNIKATFFCVGHNIEKNPEVFQDIFKRGHKIGNHTYNHLKGWNTPLNKYLDNVLLFEKQTRTDLFRPPYGKITPLQLYKLRTRYKVVLWSVLSYDFDKSVKPQKCLQNVIRYTNDGSIVVFHDSIKASDNMLYALPRFIEHFKSKGYSFDTICKDKMKMQTVNGFTSWFNLLQGDMLFSSKKEKM